MLPTDKVARRRLVIVSMTLLLIALLFIGRSAYLAFNQASLDRTNLVLMTRAPHSLAELEAQSRKLKRAAEKIENYSLAEIREILDRTAVAAKHAAREINAQQDAWAAIQARSEIDAATYIRIKSDLNTVTKMQQAEIVRLKRLLKDAERDSLPYSFMAVLATYLLGMASSFIASYLYDRWKGWKSRVGVEGGG